jgi:hypothetical protein
VSSLPRTGDTQRVDWESIEFWEWFYDSGADWLQKTPEERRRDMEERWHPDLVLNQDPQVPDTRGEFHGYEGLRAANRELYESWEAIYWQPREVHSLGGDRYLVLLESGARGRASGIELEGGEIGHIVTLRGDRAERMDVFLGWDAARDAAGLDPSE